MFGKVAQPHVQRWLRFIVGGTLNTAFTYGIYLALKLFIDYQWAYLIAYALGIVFAYCINAWMVFCVPLSWKGLLAYPLVYVIQYGISALALGVLVEFLSVPKTLAPLVVTVVMLPVTYAMSKLILKWTYFNKLVVEKKF